jgi:hypothetical protein
VDGCETAAGWTAARGGPASAWAGGAPGTARGRVRAGVRGAWRALAAAAAAVGRWLTRPGAAWPADRLGGPPDAP